MLSIFVPRDEYHIRGTGKLSRDLLAFCSSSGPSFEGAGAKM